MLQLEMDAAIREGRGKGAARKLRVIGRTPAVLYGAKGDSIALSLDTKSVTTELLKIHGQNVVIALDIHGDEAKKYHVMIKEVQKEPVHDSLVHADFFEIALDKKIALPVRVKFSGIPKGLDLGGIMNVSKDTVQVNGLPLDIPDFIEVDVSGLAIGEHLTCDILKTSANVDLLEDDDTVIVSVHYPRAAAEEASPGEGGAAAAAPESSEKAPAAAKG